MISLLLQTAENNYSTIWRPPKIGGPGRPPSSPSAKAGPDKHSKTIFAVCTLADQAKMWPKCFKKD